MTHDNKGWKPPNEKWQAVGKKGEMFVQPPSRNLAIDRIYVQIRALKHQLEDASAERRKALQAELASLRQQLAERGEGSAEAPEEERLAM